MPKATGEVIRKWGERENNWFGAAAVRLDPSADHTDGQVVVFIAQIDHHISMGLIQERDRVEIEFVRERPQSHHRYAANEVTLERITVLKFAERQS